MVVWVFFLFSFFSPIWFSRQVKRRKHVWSACCLVVSPDWKYTLCKFWDFCGKSNGLCSCVGRFYQNDFLPRSHGNSATVTKTVRPLVLGSTDSLLVWCSEAIINFRCRTEDYNDILKDVWFITSNSVFMSRKYTKFKCN